MEALTAYATYTQGHEWRTALARLSVVPPEDGPAAVEQAREEAGMRRLLAVLVPIGCNRAGDPWLARDPSSSNDSLN